MRSFWVAAIGGLVIGHILWLAGISAAIATTQVSTWALVVAAVSFAGGLAAALLGRRRWLRKTRTDELWACFWWGLAVSPVLMSVAVLGVTYL